MNCAALTLVAIFELGVGRSGFGSGKAFFDLTAIDGLSVPPLSTYLGLSDGIARLGYSAPSANHAFLTYDIRRIEVLCYKWSPLMLKGPHTSIEKPALSDPKTQPRTDYRWQEPRVCA